MGVRLDSDHRALEEHTRADAGDDLEADNFGPVRGRAEGDEESISKRHERRAKEDGDDVVACLPCEQAAEHRHDRERDQERKERASRR